MENKLLLLILALFPWSLLFSQTDTTGITDTETDIKISQAEIIAYNCQKKLTDYSIDEAEEINKWVNLWERSFGKNEPIMRVKILSDIYTGNYNTDTGKFYIENYISKYIDRYYAAQETDYEQIFVKEKGYFDHVPLNGIFDEWTKAVAFNMLALQEEGTSEYLLCNLFSGNIDGFYDMLYLRKYKKNEIRKTFYKSEIRNINLFGISAGTWMPKGSMSNYFKPSPLIGFTLGYPVYESVRADLTFDMAIFNNSENFLIEDYELMEAKGKFYFSMGFLLTKEYTIFSDFFLDVNAGISVGFLNTNQGYYSYDEEYDIETYIPYSLITGDYSAGLSLRRMIDSNSSFGIRAMYHLSPYRNENLLYTEDLGKNYISLSLIYTF